jgi:hypothetical protein
MMNLVLLVAVLRNKLGSIHWRLILSSCLKTLVAAGIMAGGVAMVCRPLIPRGVATGTLQLIAGIAAGISVGIAIFWVVAWKMKIPEWQQMMDLIQRRWNRQ